MQLQYAHTVSPKCVFCPPGCASGQAGFVWPAVWRESLIPCDLLFLQLLLDQNNQLSLCQETHRTTFFGGVINVGNSSVVGLIIIIGC